MKIKEGFVLREVMGNYVAVAVGEASRSFRGMVTLNESAANIWKLIEKGFSESEICDAMFETYEVDRTTLEADVKKTIKSFADQGFIEL